MPGLVPGIHDLLNPKTWMAGTSPAMTEWKAQVPPRHCDRNEAIQEPQVREELDCFVAPLLAMTVGGSLRREQFYA
ncbi:hypothetical protein [Tardiphaga sp.]|uniref:hypothetical protein n=1 Tax=Tardiphaga sp. TaxID=1926292 RepID=UPI00261A965B|nr:hypothetical protein [Tardiphaga sp.]